MCQCHSIIFIVRPVSAAKPSSVTDNFHKTDRHTFLTSFTKCDKITDFSCLSVYVNSATLYP